MSFRRFLRFQREGAKVVILIDPLLHGVELCLVLSNDRGSEIDAELMRLRLDSTLDKLVEQARTEAYDAGYKDGRGKQAKQGWQLSRLGKDIA